MAALKHLRHLRLTLRRGFDDFLSRYPRLSSALGLLRRRRKPILAVTHVLLHVIGFILSIQAVMQSRTEQGAVAWALSLNTVPVIAVPAFLVFGDSRLDDYAASRQAGLVETRPYAEALMKQIASQEAEIEASPLTTLEKIASLPFLAGNRVTLLVDGENTFQDIFSAIDQAEHYILVQFYIFRDDGAGSEFRERLIAKAREGVSVYVLVDDFGSLGLDEDWFTDMREEGIQVTTFMDLSGKANRFQINFRNHRKLVVVDGDVGFVGGHNVGDEYLGKHPTYTPWRDSHVRIEGPAVKALQIPFVEDWHWAAGTIPSELNWDVSEVTRKGNKEVLILATGPADPVETCSLFFLTMINEAQDRIWIATPYFVPDDKMVTALQLAAIRGVDVRILMPDMTDSTLVHFSSFSYLEEMERAGVKTYRYEKGFLHQKAVLVDDDLSAIGSANFDNRSFRLNFEVMGIVRDEVFTADVATMLEEDFANSRPVTGDDYRDRSFPFRLTVRLARLLAPIQ